MGKKDFTLGKGLGNMNPANFAAGMNTQRWGQVIYISPESIVPNPKNKYEIENIDELADNIAVYGVLQPLLVKGPLHDKTYMLLGGERRWTAVKKVIETNPAAASKLEKIPVEVYAPADMDEIDEDIIIRETNSQARNMDKYRKQDIWELYDLYKKKQERGDEMPDNIIRRISEKMGIGERQVQKIVSIDEYMIPEMKEMVADGGMSINKASKIAHLPKEKQEEVYKIMEEEGDIDMETIREIEKGSVCDENKITESEISEEDPDDTVYMPFPEIPASYADDMMEEEKDHHGAIEMVEDRSEQFYQEVEKIEKEKREREFIDRILGWMKEVDQLECLEDYQKDAMERIQELVNSILA